MTGSNRPPSNSASSNVLRAAGLMGAATLMSRLLGLVREQVFAYLFGAGNFTDAFNVAFRIPNLFRDLFAEGAMSASLVPIFTRTREEEGDLRAWRVAGLVFRFLFIFVGILALLGMVFAPNLVALYASAFKQVPGKFELTVQMTRIMFPFFPFVALAAAFMGVLNACGAFFLPALSSALFNLVSITVGVLFVEILLRWGGSWEVQPIVGMAIGVVTGGAIQAFFQLPVLYKKGYRYPKRTKTDPSWFQDPRLRKMLWMMLPGTVGLAATQVNILVNTILATSQGPGAVSWLNYAFRLMQFPIGVFGVSLASATLPKVSLLWVKKDVIAAGQTVSNSLRSAFAVNLPASAGLAFLGYPIIEMIFQYGRFYQEDTRATALALAMYSIGLTAYSAVKVLVPVCYALGNTRVPVISSALSVGLTIILNLLMIKPFGYWGLALGTSCAAIFNALFLLFAVQKLMLQEGTRGFRVISILPSFLKYLSMSLAMGGACLSLQWGLVRVFSDRFFLEHLGSSGILLGRGLRMSLLLTFGVISVVAMAKVFHLSEVLEVVDIFTKKMKNKLRLEPT
jgi:putative peptidoglycan lipid II flippase